MIAHSPWLSLEPYPNHAFSAILEATARRLPEKVAFANPEGKTYTFAALGRLLQCPHGAREGGPEIVWPILAGGIAHTGRPG